RILDSTHDPTGRQSWREALRGARICSFGGPPERSNPWQRFTGAPRGPHSILAELSCGRKPWPDARRRLLRDRVPETHAHPARWDPVVYRERVARYHPGRNSLWAVLCAGPG